VLYAPVLIAATQLLRQPPPPSDPAWLLLGLAGWIGLQLAAAAYGRGTSAMQSRYFDIFLVGVVLNVGCLFWLVRPDGSGRRRALAGAWLLAVALGGGAAFDDVPRQLAARRDTAAIQTRNVRQYVATGDASLLENKPFLHIPYPAAGPLIEFLSDPAIRAILPAQLRGEPEMHARRDMLLHYGPLLIPLGLALFMIAGMGLRAQIPSRRP
jgi:hypothetical protein